MPWRCFDTVTFNPFARQLFEDPRTQFSLSQDPNSSELEWQSYELDLQIFLQVANLIWETRGQSDIDFKKYTHLKVVSLISQSEIFKRLASKEIVVTPAHTGVVPFQHTLNVMEAMIAEKAGLEEYQVFILRFGGYYHDIGKGISDGIPYDEANTMRSQAEASNSYPNHDRVSFSILKKFGSSPQAQEFIAKIGQKTWDMMLLMIDNHHFFEFKKTQELSEFSNLKEIIAKIISDPVQFEAFLLAYTFSYADIMSNSNYQHLWPEKVVLLKELFEFLDVEIDARLLSFEIALELHLGVQDKQVEA